MRKENLRYRLFACLLLLVPLFSLQAWAQGNAAIVTVKKTLTIRDNGGDFFFQYPQAPVVNEQGYMLVEDKNQLLLFAPDGVLIKNLFKRGQGPHELTKIRGLAFEDGGILVCNKYPHKLLWFNLSGVVLKENRLSQQMEFNFYLTYYNNRLYLLDEVHGSTGNKAVIKDIPVKLVSAATDGSAHKYENISFPKKYFVRNTNRMTNVHYVQIARINAHTFLAANNGKYDIKFLDIKKMQLRPFIKKKHPRVKITKEWLKVLRPMTIPHQGVAGTEIKTYHREYLDDILRIFVNGNRIWVFTSAFDEAKRLVPVDVYDLEGRAKGTFYLKMPEGFHLFKLSYTPLSLYNQMLYLVVETESGDKEIYCGRLCNVPRWARN